MHFVHACVCLWVCSRRPTCPCLLNGESRSTEYICWRQRMQLWCGRGCIFFFFFTFFSVFIVQNETRSRTRAWKNTSKKWLTWCCPSYNAPKLTLIKWCWYCDLPKASVHVSREYWLQWCSFFFWAPAFRKRPDNGFGLTQQKKKEAAERRRENTEKVLQGKHLSYRVSNRERAPLSSFSNPPPDRAACGTYSVSCFRWSGRWNNESEWQLPHS